MNEQGEGDVDRPASSVGANPRDGSIDFTRYSSEQLRELQYGIDRQAFPQNFANLAAELERRQGEETHPDAADAAIDGRFSTRDGLIGWLEAKGRRGPLYGAGSIEVGAAQVTLRGWRRTWLGAPEQAEIEVPLADIRNVVRDGEHVRFEYRRQLPFGLTVQFTAASTEDARGLTARLPAEILARPMDPAEREEFPFRQMLVAVGFVGIAVLTLLWQGQGFGARLSGPEQYFNTHPQFVKDETENLRLWQGLVTRAGAGRITETEVADRFEHDILPFWVRAEERLRQEAHSIPAAQRPMAALVADAVRLRIAWAQAVIGLERHTQPPPPETPVALARETDYAVARVERVMMRASLDHRPLALANSSWVTSLRHLFSPEQWQCVENPEWAARSHAGDSKGDGPAERDAAGCLAQSLFMAGHYAKLDSLLRHAANSLGDLPDGNSTLDGLELGLNDLFQYGRWDLVQALGRTSDWRRAVPESVEPDLAEIQIFESWAWTARGFGGANSVSPEAWELFAHRTALAAAGLEDMQQRAASNPVWYLLSLSVGLDRSLDVEKLRGIFDAGVKKAPAYMPLYRGMLRVLMPRWHGSYTKVDHFIEEVTDRPDSADRDVELYARLYWIYNSLERDDIKLFDDSLAVWPLMKQGFRQMVKHYPKSDAVLNAFVKFACVSEDRAVYLELRPLIEHRRSATVWSEKTSTESCDKQFPPRPLVGITPYVSPPGGDTRQ